MKDSNLGNKKPELLAPAGNTVCALTAFDAGADAVYAGLSKFNARERSENFTPALLAKVIAYAHSCGKKVYVTLNTLIKECELSEVMEYLALLSDMRPDALIVQDLGVLRMIREYFPGLKIHASTQMGIHNSAGLKIAHELGVSRVILERQVTVDELELLAASSPLELEVFVHGALCCSLSGECLFSSWLGGWSGNRGKCKQPCRRRFFGKKTRGNGFFFSTQDLCGLELVPRFREMGIASLKIEGRLRKPDYVKNAVAAYRLLLDCGQPDKKLLGEARNLLSGTFGRKWSQGFYTEASAGDLISHETFGAAGALCGRVEVIEKNGFGFNASKRIHVGDRLRVQPTSGDEGPAVTVTKMSVFGQSVNKASIGQPCFVFCDKEIPKRGMVYKIGENYDEMTARAAALPEPKTTLELNIAVAGGKFRVVVANASGIAWERAVELPPAQKHPLTTEKIVTEFKIIRSDELAAGWITATVDDDYFLPAGELKTIRREFWEWAKANVDVKSLFSVAATGLEGFRRDYAALRSAKKIAATLPETVLLRPGGPLPGKRKAIKACSIFDFSKLTDEVILPPFCQETRLPSLRKMLNDAYSRGIRRFRITGLFGIALLREFDDIEIAAGFPLPICNSMASLELAELDVIRIQAWVELEHSQLEALVEKSLLPVEIYRYGRPPLLVTRAKVPVEGEVKDARGNIFVVKRDKRSGLTSVYARSVLSIPRIHGATDFYDLSNANWNERITGTFNFHHGLI